MSKKGDLEGMSRRIKERRIALGLTQGDLAKRLEFTTQAVSKWETGMGYPDIYVLPQLADILEMSVDELLGVGLDEDMEPEDAPEQESVLLFGDEDEAVFREAEKWVEETMKTGEDKEDDEIKLVLDNEEEKPKEASETAEAPEASEGQQEPETGKETADGALESDPFEKRCDDLEKRYEDFEKRYGDFDENGFAGKDIGNVFDNIGNEYKNAAENIGDFADGFFPQGLSQFINQTVRNAVKEAVKTSRPSIFGAGRAMDGRWGVKNYSGQYGEKNYSGGSVDSLGLRFCGAGDVEVVSGVEGNGWHIEIEAPIEIIDGIQCTDAGGRLMLLVPSLRQLGFTSIKREPSVNVKITTGFAVGAHLDVDLRGSTDIKIEPDFAQTNISVAGSGDVEMKNAGILNYRVSGSGDFSFENAHDVKMRIMGSGDVNGRSINGHNAMKVSGSGSFSFNEAFGEIEFSAAGSGDCNIGAGMLDKLRVQISGSGDFHAPNLEIKDLDVQIAGGGEVVVGSVSGNITKKMSRASRLKIIRQ